LVAEDYGCKFGEIKGADLAAEQTEEIREE
jgi:hypothetical protein